MRTLVTIGTFLCCMLMACERDNDAFGNSFELDETVELKNFETLFNYTHGISIHMDSVLSDGRCPSDLICIWGGNAEVRFIFKHFAKRTEVILHTHGGEASVGVYRIKLISLDPYPDSKSTIAQNKYVSKIIVTRE